MFSFLCKLPTFSSPFSKLQTTPAEALRAIVSEEACLSQETTLKMEMVGFRRHQGEGGPPPTFCKPLPTNRSPSTVAPETLALSCLIKADVSFRLQCVRCISSTVGSQGPRGLNQSAMVHSQRRGGSQTP